MTQKNAAAVELGRKGGQARVRRERERQAAMEEMARELNALRAKLARSLRKTPMAPKGTEG